MTLSPSFYKFCIFFLIGICLVLLYKSCHPSTPSPAITQNQQANDSVGKLLQVVKESNMTIGFLREDSIRQDGVIKDKDVQLSQTQAKLDKANKQSVGFANGVVTARANKDTNSYIVNCDSLAYVTQRDQHIKDSLKNATTAALNARDRANKIANDSKSALQKSVVAYSGALSLLQKTNANLAAAATPTRKLFIGGEVFVAPGIAGVGPGVLYENLKNQVFGLSGGAATTGGWWIGGKGYFLIKLHK